MGPYLDRADAGRRLAAALEPYRAARPVVVGLPRGGVVVAAEIARALDAPLDVLVARKLGAPFNPEFAIGAVAPGVVHVDESTVKALVIPRDYVTGVIAREEEERGRREARYRSAGPPTSVAGRTVILVDDGLATGATAIAAIESLRRQGPAAIILAAPVGAPDTAALLRRRVDDLVCLSTPSRFRAVGQAYVEFGPVEDAEVVALLAGRARS